MSIFNDCRKIVVEELEKGQKLAVYPFGKNGLLLKNIIENMFGQRAIYIDNLVSKYNKDVISIDEFRNFDSQNITIIICAQDIELNRSLTSEIWIKGYKAKIRNIFSNEYTSLNEKEKNYSRIRDLLSVKKVEGYRLVRVGANYDGGYALIDNLDMSGCAFSFGIGTDTSWDEGMLSHGFSVYAFDHTINRLPIGNEKIKWYKMAVGGRTDYNAGILSLEDAVNLCDEEVEKWILKMDIEGAEWNTLSNTTEKLLMRFDQMVFEFHELQLKKDPEKIEILSKLNRTHQVVWVHANNRGYVDYAGDVGIPNTIEVLYANKKNYKFSDIKYDCPIDIDYPNRPDRDEIVLKGWGTIR